MAARSKGWIAGVLAGGLLMLAPIAGFLLTVLGLVFSFGAVESADPAHKAEQLAQGISVSMYSTAIGIALFPIGAILVGFSLFQLLRRRD